ncbi:MAG: ATP-dependent helicase RecG [Pseudonocardiales bacterium]|nr:ATP-dependent helicase RecG [Pseudonocardiales bacterium]
MSTVTPDSLLRDVVGGRTSTALEKHLNLTYVRDLLRYYPRRYAERGQLTDLRRLQVGEDVTVMATVHSVKTIRMRSKRGTITDVTVGDGTSRMSLSFFNQSWREKDLQPGRSGLFAGKVSEFRGNRKLNNPDYILLDGDAADETVQDFAGTLIPVYPGTSALPSWTIARCVRIALDALTPIEDPLPSQMQAELALMDLDSALRRIHRPNDRGEYREARHRLAWDEAFGIQLTLAQRRHRASVNPAYPRPRIPGGIADAFDAKLPFELTAGQLVVAGEIAHDLADTHPMQRLLQGEVGSGKTIVALRAMLQVIDTGAQAALLAPTEVLAAQHARSIEAMLGDLAAAGRFEAAENATKVTLLTGSLSAGARRKALLEVATGEAGIVIGTHALIQKTVEFAELGLVVVDEQHRFGVEQRDALRAKSAAPPHLLVMTATPIPRTVAMTVFGDLDTSILRELPAGRAPITSTVVPAGEKPAWLNRAWERVAEEVSHGRQAYIVCPRIGDEVDAGTKAVADTDGDEYDPDSDEDAARPSRAVLELAQELRDGPLSGVRLDALHGRMAADEKDAVMRRFAAKELDVLVATTVIEVGVDVPNATVMVVMDAERFGVSQLHQLRGRVGRGGHPGLCLLVTDAPAGSSARIRLDAVAAESDGFALAQVDLRQRREGDVLGVSQSGRKTHLKLLSLLDDEALIDSARVVAGRFIKSDPELVGYPLLAQQVSDLVDDERSRFLDKA